MQRLVASKMFDLPDAKRVRRAELYSSPGTSRSPSPDDNSSPDPDVQAKLQARLASIYGEPVNTFDSQPSSASKLPRKDDTDTTASENAKRKDKVQGKEPKQKGHANTDATREGKGGELDDGDDFDAAAAATTKPDEQAFEFRLFSTNSKSDSIETPIQQIILEPDDGPDTDLLGERISYGEGGFLRDRKDPRVFNVERATGQKLEEFEFAAMTGDQVLEASTARNWGLEVPWRVIVLQSSSKNKSTHVKVDVKSTVDDETSKKKRKLGKKRRIVLRMRIKKVEAEKERMEKEAQEKEEADKERKTRKNREKKMKQKMRAKAKAETAAGGGSASAALAFDGGKDEDDAIDKE